MRSLTTRRKPEAVEALQPIQIGRAASQRGGRPVIRSQISPPLALVSTTNMLSFNAPDIAGTKPIQSATPSSATSSSSDESDSSALSIHSRETDPTDLSSADVSPISAEPDNHLSHYFKTANHEAFLRQRSLSAARTNPVPVLSLSVAAPATIPETLTPNACPVTALTPNAAMPTPATALSPHTAGLTPATALSPSTAAMYQSALAMSPNGLSPVSAIRTPISAIRYTGDSSPESPILPRRAPSHSKRAHEALSRKRSVQRARSPATRTSADMFNTLSPAAFVDSPDSIFSPALAQVQEETSKSKYADAALDAHVIKTRGLASLDAMDYLNEIDGLVAVLLDDNAPTGPDFSGWF